MPNVRSILTLDAIDFPFVTRLRGDQVIEGSWSHPNVPLLIFDDHQLPGTSVTHHGGPIGTGLPVQLLFWGSWWNTQDGAVRASMIQNSAQALIASEYFSELQQYGINRPTYRGSLIVTQPAPPMVFNSTRDEQAVWDMVGDLIDDDVFPDPDDGRIAFMVFMPSGFTQTINADGAHYYDWVYDPPFDTDNYWVGWIRFFDTDPDNAISTMSHELVELFTDPETDGWYCSTPQTGEVGDAAVSSGTNQEAYVNGAKAQAYWSNRHAATVLPIDRDYRARIRGVNSEESRTTIEEGTFRPDPEDQNFCRFVQACCLSDRDYSYQVIGHNEVIRLRCEKERYLQPKFVWSIEGAPLGASNGVIEVNVIAQRFEGRRSISEPNNVMIEYRITNNTIELRQLGPRRNFDITVRCSVTDDSIKGKVRVNVVAKPEVRIGFAGAELILDEAYVEARKACSKAVYEMFGQVGHGGISHTPKPGEPNILDASILNELPAYTRMSQYRAARELVLMSRAAAVALPLEVAQAYVRSMAADIPALADTLAARESSISVVTESGDTASTISEEEEADYNE